MNITDRTINPLRPTPVYEQSENASLPYTIDYAAMLDGDTIDTSTWSSPNGSLTITDSNTDTAATAIISGQPGTHIIVNKIVTAAGITDERVMKLVIRRNDSYTTRDY